VQKQASSVNALTACIGLDRNRGGEIRAGRSSVSRWQTRREEREAAKWQQQNVVAVAGLQSRIRPVVVAEIRVSAGIVGARLWRLLFVTVAGVVIRPSVGIIAGAIRAAWARSPEF
jgi:hypothetical protein